MVLFSQLFITGLIVSSLYTLVAVGFTMYVGVINIANFSHGDTCVMGSFFLMPIIPFLLRGVESDIGIVGVVLVSIAIVVMITGIWGVFIYNFLIRPLLKTGRLMILLATVAAGQVIRELIRLIYPNGSNPQVFPRILPSGGIKLGEFILNWDALIVIGVTVAIIIALNYFISQTKMGLAMRSVSQNGDVAQMMGINITRTIIIVFIIGSALAGLAGIMNGAYYGITKFSLGNGLGIKGFSASVIGGLGNFKGAVLGGILLGFVEVFASAFIPGGSPYQDVFSFLAVVGFLIFKPVGILGAPVFEKV